MVTIFWDISNANYYYTLDYMLETFLSKMLLFFSHNTLFTQTNQQEKTESTSSETTSSGSFNFSLFTKNYKVIDRAWLEWFCGFAEGDGSWIVSGKRLFFPFNTERSCSIKYD